MNDKTADRAGIILGLVLCLAIPLNASAFPLEGTADVDLNPGGDAGDTTFVAPAGFEMSTQTGEWELVAFAEFGPETTIAGRFDAAGQLWLRLPVAGRSGSIDAVYDADDPSLSLLYVEWNRSGGSVQSTRADGTVDVVGSWLDGIPVHVDVQVALEIGLDDGSVRRLDGALFGGSLTVPGVAQRPYDAPSRPRYYRYHDGCASEPRVVYGVDYYDEYDAADDSGCGGDEYGYEDEQYSDDGCASDSSDSGSGDDGGCEGDDLSDSDSDAGDEGEDDEEEESSDMQCAGDDGTTAGWSLPISARHIHLWAPLAFVLLLRRRTPREASGPGCR